MKLRNLIFILLMSVLFLFTVVPAQATLIWGTTPTDAELNSGRTSDPAPVSPDVGGVHATGQWVNGAFDIDWAIEQDPTTFYWTYIYTITTTEKDISHFILEVTEDDDPFEVFGGDATIDENSLKTWSEFSMPNSIYGVKFDFGPEEEEGAVIYTIVTDRAPVYGVFFAKSGADVEAWSNALNLSNYKYTEVLTKMDYIVRPDGGAGGGGGGGYPVPEPATMLLLGSGLIGIAVSGKKRLKKKKRIVCSRKYSRSRLET